MICFGKSVRSEKKGHKVMYDLEGPSTPLSFPATKGAPTSHYYGLCRCPKQFRVCQETVLANAKSLAARLRRASFNIVLGGTDSHLVRVDLKSW